jgi:hypothetical protein
MSEWRSRTAGRRHLRGAAFTALVVLLTAAWASLALAASGGAGVGGTGKPKARPKHGLAQPASGNPLGGRGMWIWYVSRSSAGTVASIVATAHRYGVTTLMIKSGDGGSMWSQFTPQLVAAFHANHLKVCGWQYVYGNSPVAEANIGADAVKAGADCLMIDAEGEYEGKYVSAQTYIRSLRAQIGASFPVALAGFPFVDFHPAFPYSVFLGPGGAQYNAPQMYWHDIGDSVDYTYAHTYAFNRIYQRQIFPIGQVYNSPPTSQVRRFRQVSRAYGAANVSWWDWQEAPAAQWRAISQRIGSLGGYQPSTLMASLGKGARGDVVVWAQEHLVRAGFRLTIDGAFGPGTLSAVRQFQAAHGLATDGKVGTFTWQALLRYPPVRVQWTKGGARTASVARGGVVTALVPASARLRAKRYEIGRWHGRG